MIFFVSERPDDGADFSIIAIHILGIADTFQECVVVLVLLRIVATLDHSDIASDGFLPGIEAVVVVAGRVVESERDTNLSPVTLLVSKFPFYEQARQAIPDEREWDVRKTQEEDMNEGTGTCFIND
jgi:hypothetical protein